MSLLFAVASLFTVTIFVHKVSAQSVPVRQEVFLGDVFFSPQQVTTGGTSTLKISVGTTSTVTSRTIQAVLSVALSSNPGGIPHTISGGVLVILLQGAGALSTGELTVTIANNNTTSGNIIYSVTLDHLEGAI
ncbi:MAG: hypothetical protein ACRD4L_00480, partial [Pyrinomonadaceae bacterium]